MTHDTPPPPPPTDAAAPVPGTPAVPDRLSTDPRSPYYVAAWLERGVGILFNGHERTDVEEYCLSGGWIKVASGKSRDRRGQPLLIQLKGRVEAFVK